MTAANTAKSWSSAAARPVLRSGISWLRQGRNFAILEAAEEPAAAWRARWDSLKLFTPARYSSLPGLPFPGDPDAYPRRDDVASYLTEYARHFALPVVLGSRVRVIRRAEGRYLVELDGPQLHGRSGRDRDRDRSRCRSCPRSRTTSVKTSFRSTAPGTGRRGTFPTVRCWSSVAATPAFRSPKSSPPPARFTCRSGRGRRRCLSGFSVATCSGISRRPGRCASRPDTRIGRRLAGHETP